MLRILGPVDIQRGERSLTVTGVKQRTLLAVLALHANRSVSHERLLTALWGSAIPDNARRLLHSHLWGLRRLLSDEEPLENTPQGYLLRLRPGMCDLDLFTTETALARSALAAGDAAEAARRFRVALALWRGPALGGTQPEFQAAEGPGLEEQHRAALNDRIEADLRCGQNTELIGELRHLINDRPLDERLHAQLLLALYRAGRQAEALAVFRDLRRMLNAELGLEPGPELQQLHQRVLAADPELHPAAATAASVPVEAPPPPPPATTTPAASSAVSPRDRAPGVETTSVGETSGPCQLPRAVGDFTSRDSEVAHLMRETAGDAAPAVVIESIDGMAGVGKTALAIHVAHRLAARFPGGQLYVDLHGHTPGRQPVMPVEALRVLLRAVGTPSEEIPSDVEEAAAVWRSAASSRRMLIVLDNAATTGQVRPLLPGRSGSHILITSRRRLAGLEDAAVLSLDVLTHADAAALFTRIVGAERVAAQQQAVDEVVDLCGGLPLALRIAAARLVHRPAWTVRDLATRLGDQRRRLQELRADNRDVATAFALSYGQLPAIQQRLFRLLGLIPGDDFDAYAAAALSGLAVGDAEQGLEELLDAHLLQQHTAGRYRFHDLLRDYAQQSCQSAEPDSERDAAVERLRSHYLLTTILATATLGYGDPRDQPSPTSAAAEKSPALTTPEHATAWLQAERGNLLAAALTCHDAWAVAISTVVWRYLNFSAHHGDALTLHSHAADIAQRLDDQNAHIQTLINLGIAYWRTAQHEQALHYQRHALAIARRIGDHIAQSRALNLLGIVYADMGRPEQSNDHFEQALALAREANDRPQENRILINLGINHERLGNYPRALRYQQRALAYARELGDVISEGRTLSSLGHIHRRTGRYEIAVNHFQLALAIADQAGDRTMEANVLNQLGVVYGRLGRLQEALDHQRRSLDLSTDTANRVVHADVLVEIGDLHHRSGRYQHARDHYRQALAVIGETGDPVIKIAALNGLGQAACATGDPAQALDHHHQALKLALAMSHSYGQACAHCGIGDALHLTDRNAATESWRQALNLFTRLGVPETEEVRARLALTNEADTLPSTVPTFGS
ncbi:tetratricopeptide repeat protein [Planomonospora sp. ID67723]|uniref:AfsR/SARP family transcriptional regulator n=1 Tax=Planomonospora sp. ID67723 TaxID=2738134 RepID=UPI0018C38BC2|nr:tetratricopeptide repeat protein [Planomonospora sp. ID67723]MBG0831620.1 tetratricopeptide repeat protein [Planomonospora sp. ID67723]